MRKGALLALGSLGGVLAFLLGLTAPAQPQKPPAEETLSQRLARVTQVSEEDIAKIFNELGPAIQYDLTHGKQVSFVGLGTFRVVRVPEHRDMKNGQVVTVPAVNTVEFLATDKLKEASNGSGAVPAETVPEYRFNPFPQQTPGQRVPLIRNPGVRTPS
jgi:nucleoid DNA-binding protein